MTEVTSLTSWAAVVALITLTLLEIVLGIDNIIFISVLSDRLPPDQQARARRLGLTLAMGMRILLLLSISWIMSITTPLPGLGHAITPVLGDDKPFNWRDLILFTGGLFLIYKSVTEIHESLEGEEEIAGQKGKRLTFGSVILQIMVLDIVFSLDSVITAVGMVQTTAENRTPGLVVMIVAVVVAVGVMLFAAKGIGEFINRHPTVKMLAFSFLILVGVVLIVDSTHRHIPKGYVYFSMAFSVGVEMLNLRLRRGKPVKLHAHQPE